MVSAVERVVSVDSAERSSSRKCKDKINIIINIQKSGAAGANRRGVRARKNGI